MRNNGQDDIGLYLQEIGKIKPLTDKEEQELSAKSLNGDTAARGRLVQANLRYAVTVAKDYRGRGLGMDDLVSEAQIGMLRAAEKFDGSRGTRFVKFAAPFMRQSIERALDNQLALYKVPKKDRTANEEKQAIPLSVDAPIRPGANVSLLHVVEDKDAPHADVDAENKSMTAELDRAVAFLPEREQKVVRLFYGIGADKLSYMEIAMLMGLKRERVRQIHKTAIRKIAKRTSSTALKSFLKR